MQSEVAVEKKPLKESTVAELRELAKSMGMNIDSGATKDTLMRAIEIEQRKRQIAIDEEAREQLKQERMKALGFKAAENRLPTFEEVAIWGGTWQGKKYPPSKKLIVEFFDQNDPDNPFGFTKGGHFFQFFQNDASGVPFLNVVPECLITKAKEFAGISLAHLGSPIYKDVEDEKTGRMVSRIVGYRPRFRFSVVREAPPDAPFGIYEEKEQQNDTNKT